MLIGTFHEADPGYSGRITTLTLDAALAIVPAAPSDTENAPDWRVLLGEADSRIEVGAGWDRTGERAGPYIALQIDDPALPVSLRANLIRSARDDSEHHLLWSRSQPQDRS
ncbi:DUF736 domain-containing protein [Sphingopyxis flava]|uniref:Uncharacterized conserved protein, DUF736 family n=1 Tax=Sphingopyxis flava TaxID=1507287 RepID=A0A1T5DTM9_9SPHN|nr:DUF736 domain-containing protein [Sphingopyxis flava]SKB74880.1 Uncharacterized conserved protein, DUF736 family [Sphingopyxis flava]